MAVARKVHVLELAEHGMMIFTSDAVHLRDSYGPPATPAADRTCTSATTKERR
jgi:hypothetical protein